MPNNSSQSLDTFNARQFLSQSKWQAIEKNYCDHVSTWTTAFRKRRTEGGSHPIHDFLFVYYQHSSGKFEKWHPGIGVELENAAILETHFSGAHYSETGNECANLICDATRLKPKEVTRLKRIAELLKRTESNKPNYSCHGLHEWAMVYRGDQVRHEKTTDLRVSQKEIDSLVESRPITCTHFDAFRFFAIDAKPLNRIKPTLESREYFEQPACIHATMDLYKWAFKSMPWIGSSLLLECFELAMLAREIDMRASPYDLSKYGSFQPIKIETADGRAEYEIHQRRLAEMAAPLRKSLIEKIVSVYTSGPQHKLP